MIDLSKADCEGRELHADSQTNPCGDAEYSSSYTLTSVAPASPLSPKNTDSPGSFNSPPRNFRRLVSLERDICCQTSQGISACMKYRMNYLFFFSDFSLEPNRLTM